MRIVKKNVRFFELRVDTGTKQVKAPKQYWLTLLRSLSRRNPQNRRTFISGFEYAGDARTCKSPSTPYLYIGRLRPPADQPDDYDGTTGQTSPIALARHHSISEGTWLVPFGLANRVAVVTPISGPSHASTLSRFITAMTPKLKTNDVMQLVPMIDVKLLEKVQASPGASKISVRVPPDAPIPDGGSSLGDALRRAKQVASVGMSIEIVFSYGNLKPDPQGADELRQAAEWIARNDFASSASASLQIKESDGGYRTEVHNLLLDKITEQVEFHVPADRHLKEEEVIRPILEAVEKMQKRWHF